jgi:hypothetical protein
VIHTPTWAQGLHLFNEVRFHSMLLRMVNTENELQFKWHLESQVFWDVTLGD